MADISELSFTGDWRVTVTSRDAGWNQRVVASATAEGTRTLAGVPGASMDVLGNGQAPWKLRIEHDDGSSGWQPNLLDPTSLQVGARLEYGVGSEDITGPSSDRDFNDLVVLLQKRGMAAQPVPPFAVRPETLQAMPEGIFEATLGRYFMAVRVRNIWTLTWPASSSVGVTDRCRAWLAAAGIRIVDPWLPQDEAALGQRVSGGRVLVGALPAWESRVIYFKVDVADATVKKHRVELQVHTAVGSEDVALISPKASAPICVTRTTYDSANAVFVSRSDVGTLTASIKELTVDLATFKRAMGVARRLAAGLGGAGGPGGPGGGCDPRTMETVREQLRAFLDGKPVDLCAMWRDIACYCASDCDKPKGDDPWTEGTDPGLGFFAWPTRVDYAIDYDPTFEGQFGPIPFDDPWWKVLLIIIAIILTIAAAASSVADLANRSDDVVIGTLTRSILNAQSSAPSPLPASTDPGSIDAAVATLNGNRSLTAAVFSVLDAASGEFFTTPVVGLDGLIDTPGSIVTNAQIDAIFQNLAANPGDPAAQDAVRCFKSGARSGIGAGVMSSLLPSAPRTDDGVVSFFINQLRISQDGNTSDSLSCAGDSGSLWFQQGSHAVLALNHGGPVDESGTFALACRIEDVVNQLGVRFA